MCPIPYSLFPIPHTICILRGNYPWLYLRAQAGSGPEGREITNHTLQVLVCLVIPFGAPHSLRLTTDQGSHSECIPLCNRICRV